MAAPAAWTCPGCHQRTLTSYCAQCGEEPASPRDLTLRGLAEKVLHAVTSIDARAARTAQCLLRQPGELTLSWVQGRRKPFVAPFQLFLIANVLFFALQWLTGANIFSSTLASHLHQQDWSEFAAERVQRHLEATGQSMEAYAPLFDRAVVLHAKSLILLMAAPFTLVLPIVFVRKRRPFMTHVVFAMHLYSFLLLLFCAAILVGRLSEWAGLGGLNAPMVDSVLSVALLGTCALYIHAAIGPVYGSRGALRVVQATVLAIAVAAIVLGYRFALLLITLHST
jgi:hypothetical protein